MVVALDSNLTAILRSEAEIAGVDPERFALDLIRKGLKRPLIEPQDEWERELLESARPWGDSLSNEAVGRNEIYGG